MVVMGSWASMLGCLRAFRYSNHAGLENYEFEIEETPFEVSSPSIGQRYIFDRSRRTVRDLLARTIGSTRLTEDESDLGRLQVLIDRRVIRERMLKPGRHWVWCLAIVGRRTWFEVGDV